MSKRQMVKGVPDKAFGTLVDFLKKAQKDPIWFERLKVMLKGKNPFEQVQEVAKNTKNWLQLIVDLERNCHRDFFGRIFSLAEFTRTLKKYGAEKVEAWKELGLEPHFLPTVSMMPKDDYSGWKVKPEGWFYKMIAQSKILRNINGKLKKVKTVGLEGITVLVDTRLKPRYGDEYKDDYLDLIITQLRESAKIENYKFSASRFNVSAQETELLKADTAKILDLNPAQLRLELEIEANVISQMYSHTPRKDDGKTNTWEWREEFLRGRAGRLDGGFSDVGGLACVHYSSVSYHWHSRAFRFLAVL